MKPAYIQTHADRAKVNRYMYSRFGLQSSASSARLGRG